MIVKKVHTYFGFRNNNLLAQSKSSEQLLGDSRARQWVAHVSILLPILAVYYCLAFYRIGAQSLWVDEVFTALAVHPDKSFFDVGIWRLGSRPLYFTLLHVWAQFGNTEVALRSFSALVGGMGVVLVYILGIRLFDRRVASIATVLFATSPFLIWYSQEVRYITLLMTSSLFAMYCYHRALSMPRLQSWLVYGCSLVIAIGAFLTNVLLVIIHGLYLICLPSRWKTLRVLVACQLFVFLLFVWWANEWHYRELGGYWERLFNEVTLERDELSSISRKERFSRGGKRDFDLAAIPYTFFTFSAGFSLGPSVRELQMDRSLGTLIPHAAILFFVSALYGGLFVLGLTALRRQRDNAVFLALWLIIPIVAACSVSALTHAAYNVRYVTMILPAYIFILVAGILKLPSRRFQHIALGGVLITNGCSLANYYFDSRYAREDTRNAARYVAYSARPQDAIVIVGSGTAFRYYYGGAVPVRSWNWEGEETAARLKELAIEHDRLWLIETRRWERDKEAKLRNMTEQIYKRISHQLFAGVDVYLYDVKLGVNSRWRAEPKLARETPKDSRHSNTVIPVVN